jgi:hypothetical protein
VYNIIQACQHSAISESQNSNTCFIEFYFSIEIRAFTTVPEMTGAIEFDRELCFFTVEINNPIRYWVLAAKF